MKLEHKDCPDCFGRGFIIDPAGSYGCPRCNGTGIYANYKHLLALFVVGLIIGFVGIAVWFAVA